MQEIWIHTTFVEKSSRLLLISSVSLTPFFAGHALAWLDPTFKKITFSDKVKEVCRRLGFRDPRLIQSMYVFKNPGKGSCN